PTHPPSDRLSGFIESLDNALQLVLHVVCGLGDGAALIKGKRGSRSEPPLIVHFPECVRTARKHGDKQAFSFPGNKRPRLHDLTLFVETLVDRKSTRLNSSHVNI